MAPRRRLDGLSVDEREQEMLLQKSGGRKGAMKSPPGRFDKELVGDL